MRLPTLLSNRLLNNGMKAPKGRTRRKYGLMTLAISIPSYATIIIYWQHSQLSINTRDVNEIIRISKDSYLGGSIEAFDLSVNYLKLIKEAAGAPPFPPLVPSASNARAMEDFLPVVLPSGVTFRWRHRARAGSLSEDSTIIRAYRIVVVRRSSVRARIESLVWDSGRINVDEDTGAPDFVKWGGTLPPSIGQILEWQVHIWDAKEAMSSSSWEKFAVGPENKVDWLGDWISHPEDLSTFDRRKKKGKTALNDECKGWQLRRPLPLFRTQIDFKEILGSQDDTIISALLLISGLGSFRASFDGIPLSTSGPIDPPFTDYSKRVSYRGFDLTPFMIGPNGRLHESHTLGVTMGSGWWDHRPVSGMVKPKLLPRGPVTTIAQIVITYESGDTRVIGQTNPEKWQVSRGHILESDLFTGESIDLMVLEMMESWDTPHGWSNVTSELKSNMDPTKEINRWTKPIRYHTDITIEQRVQEMSIKAKAMNRSAAEGYPVPQEFSSPIGKLIPNEIPPVLPMELIAPDEIHNLGSGRWLLDFGKAMSGMLHFGNGLPKPIVPTNYPRAHGFKSASSKNDAFITVIYGESLELTTGDINRVLVAGMGLHDGGWKHLSKSANHTKNTKCFPNDHEAILTQRDVYVVPKRKIARQKTLFSKARQSHFTTHSFRFVEICCIENTPTGIHALLYRTAVDEWGFFDSSNVNINGGYELVRNSLKSNMLSVQSDCPHREKLPYGGDLIASSPAAMHFFDMSGFYKKTITDWLDAQWSNGAYTETSIWQNLNDYAGIGRGAGETVWASAPPVLTVRHMQHYGDVELLALSFENHVNWLKFLGSYFDDGMRTKNYDDELKNYTGRFSGLGDWLAMRPRDTFLTHTAFAMASGRCVAYIAHKLGARSVKTAALGFAKKYEGRISSLYLKNGKDNFDFPRGSAIHTPGPEMSLFTRIVPGPKRCVILKNWFKREGNTWPGDEEMNFLNEISETYLKHLVHSGEVSKRKGKWAMGWSQWRGFNEGILAIRYSLKVLSDNGFHHIALRKAAGFGFATPEYLLRHNATTMWESWWRSEDLYSRNHPMLGEQVSGIDIFNFVFIY
mmetsp:Transcript_20452/g.42912  ORF Transcript_20452/g.42912 Transcript_20452/m.42912 type:complete len:1082 (-) Transcript_20452:914-4159(-)